MLTLFAKPNRRFHTEDGGLRFWLDPISFQTTFTRHDESVALDETRFNVNLIFEEREPCEGFRSYIYSEDIPDFNCSVVSMVTPMLLQRATIEVRFQYLKHQKTICDIERSLDHEELKIAICWSDQENLSFAQFLSWLAGSDVLMPERFWIDQIPDVSLVRRVP